MKFIIDSTKILKALENMQGIVTKKHASDILSNVCLSTENGKLTINATDSDMDLVEVLDAETVNSGATTASGSLLYETARRLPANTPIEFSYDNDQLEIKCGKFKGKLSCLPAEDFPVIRSNDFNSSFNIEVSHLKHLITKTRFAISLDETRYFLNGIYLHTITNEGKNFLRSVSTDGHRLALCEVEVADANINQGVIIPKKTVDELIKLLNNVEDKEVKISVSATRISFKFNNITLTSQVIDGNFPEYNKVIPTENLAEVETNKDDLLNYVELISAYSDTNLKAIKLEITKDKMVLSANKNNAAGEHILDITTNADNLSICFNARYIHDVCKHIDTENVIMKISDSGSPAIIKKTGGNDELYVVMPMKL